MSKNSLRFFVLGLLQIMIVIVCSRSSEAFIPQRLNSPRISLQYLQAYGPNSYPDYSKQLSLVPNTNDKNLINMVSPNWYCLNSDMKGTFKGPWDTSSGNYNQLIAIAHSRGLKILPLIAADWSNAGKVALDSVLSQETSRSNLINQLVNMITSTGADGVVIDFEYMSSSTGPYLTQFIQELSSELRSRNKLLVEAVPSRTATSNLYPAFNYHKLSQSVDYLAIMTYDYSSAKPGPLAPPDWIRKVLEYAQSQNVSMTKVLLGLPYYGRDWSKTGSGYKAKALNLDQAAGKAAEYAAPIGRETTQYDPVGIPHYDYTDSNGTEHFVYFDDCDSWKAKLALLDEYNLGGVQGWSVMWLNDNIAHSLFSLFRDNARD